jgi:hypothetical protein
VKPSQPLTHKTPTRVTERHHPTEHSAKPFHSVPYIHTSKKTKYQSKTMADRDLSEEEVADLKEAFAMFDINGDGE